MTRWEQVACTRCGDRTAMSTDQVAHMRETWHLKFPYSPPPMTPNVCTRCAWEDPAFRSEFEAWIESGQQYLTQRARDALARPLELIDELVERFS